MKKKLFGMMLAAMVFSVSVIPVYADTGAAVTFTQDKKLEYSGVTSDADGVNLGAAFENVAPGESRSQTITVKNENTRTADFYMSAEAVKALENGAAAAKGAGYEIRLTAGDAVLYDSTLGGYKNAVASESGIEGMNDALEDSILIATLKQGESVNVVLSIAFDGEAMDNTSVIDYSLTNGQLAFEFQVGYEDPTGTTVIVREVSEDGQVRYVKKIVEILENGVPLGAVATGDGAMIGIAVLVLAAGIFMVIAGKKKSREEEA